MHDLTPDDDAPETDTADSDTPDIDGDEPTLPDESDDALDEDDDEDDDDDDEDDVDEDDVDEDDDDVDEDDGPSILETEFPDGHVDYEFTDWSGQSRVLLSNMLDSQEVAHIWQGGTLMVRISDEAIADELIEIVNQSATQGLDPDRARVVYEVGEWSAALQTELADQLGLARIPFEWDERGDLVVYEDDEARVETILDEIPDPDEDEEDADGVEVAALLSSLWEAARVLSSRPKDADAVIAAVDAADRLENLSLPFGFESAVWRDLVAKAVVLRNALVSDDPDDQMSDDDLMEGCAQLHEQLRQYV